MITKNMGMFGKKAKNETKCDVCDLELPTKCDVCDLELPTPERLDRHKKKAHGNVPEKKMDDSGGNIGEGGLW